MTHRRQRLKQIACALCGAWVRDRRRMKQAPVVCESCERKKREKEKLPVADNQRPLGTAIHS